MLTNVVEISDNEEADDCIIKSVTIVVDDESESEIYKEACKESLLLANFIEKCLKLDNSECMRTILKEDLLRYYHEADKIARESPRFQKNLRRANFLVATDPQYKFSHIKDLCNILKAIPIKKRVPFVTLTTNLTDGNSKSNALKRSSTEQLDLISVRSKKPNLNDNILPNQQLNATEDKSIVPRSNENLPSPESTSNMKQPDVIYGASKVNLDSSNISPFMDSNSYIFNDSCDTIDDSMSMEPCNQQSTSSVAEEDKLLIPKKVVPFVSSTTEKTLKHIESKIAYYKKAIAVLDELEVDDDSDNSPYIKSERIKTRIVALFKKRCQLLGSQLGKRTGIRLKLADGHPPGPTRALEIFLNKNLNKDGDPPFPDFCDVVNCVTEANKKDLLGWTKAQIFNEASALFTLCGRALQKRRQHREYRDLVDRVKLEDLEKDPADDDPELRAKLEANKRIAVKKESEILERYTMMQYLPQKPKKQNSTTIIKKTGSEGITDEAGAQKEVANNSNDEGNSKSNMENSETNIDSNFIKHNVKNMNAHTSNLNVEKHKSDESLHDTNKNTLNKCEFTMVDDDDKRIVLPSRLDENVETKNGSVVNSGSDKDNKTINEGANHVIKQVRKLKKKDCTKIAISNNDSQTNISNVIKDPVENQVEKVKPVENQVENVKPVENQVEKVKSVENQVGKVKAVKNHAEKLKPVKNLVEKVKPVENKVEKVKPVENQVEKVKPVQNQVENVKPVQNQVENVKPVQNQVEKLKPVKKQVEKVKPVENQVEKVKSVENQVGKVKAVKNHAEKLKPVKNLVEKVKPVENQVEKVKPVENKVEKVKPVENHVEKVKPIQTQVHDKLVEDPMSVFKQLGDNFTLTVEIMSDS